MGASSTPGRCATISMATTPGDPIQYLNDEDRDGPHECETGHLAGWVVELPTKQVGGRFTKRETLMLTSLPPRLRNVMGEREYQEQIVNIRELTEKHSKRLLQLKLAPMIFMVLVMLFSIGTPIVFAIPLFLGIISDNIYLGASMIAIIALILSMPVIILGGVWAYYRVGMASKELCYTIDHATCHWEARGIAWRLKTSNPIAAVSGGKHPQAIATYRPRVYVECAPDAADLFEAHGPFPVDHSVVVESIERFEDYGSITDADRGSVRTGGGPDGTAMFSLPYLDLFFNKLRHMVSKRPLMLGNVMSTNEFAEQIGVINREMERLYRPWRISYMVFLLSAVALMPAIFTSVIPFAVWSLAGWTTFLWIPIAFMVFCILAPIAGFLGGAVATCAFHRATHEKLAAVVEKESKRWADRGIEWFVTEESYHLTCRGHSTDHTERRIAVRALPDAMDKFQTMGPFAPGAIDGAASVTHDLSDF